MQDQIKINENVICILKHEVNSNKIIVDYEPIIRTLDNEFEVLLRMFESPHSDTKTILTYIRNDDKLNVLFLQYNYCKSLSDSYQGLTGLIVDIERKYSSVFNQVGDIEEQRKKEKKNLLEECKDRLLAYYLAETYKICEKKRLEKSVLAYSHRKVGWSTPKYFLNEHFSIELKTNFGYGYVSYFYARITYKNLDIIPFSDWITYEVAEIYELIRYSYKYLLEPPPRKDDIKYDITGSLSNKKNNRLWVEAMEYSRDACNLSLTNEIAFVRKYVIDECEKMVVGLEGILKNKHFKFWTTARKYTDAHKEGHNLIEFRGEKISGALKFIEKIIQFENIAEIKEFVVRIKTCNLLMQPILIQEIQIINGELMKLYSSLEVLQDKHEKLKLKNNQYNLERKTLRKYLVRNGELNLHDIFSGIFEGKYLLQNPVYVKFKGEYEQTAIKYDALKMQILSLETVKLNIEKYYKVIEQYFQ